MQSSGIFDSYTVETGILNRKNDFLLLLTMNQYLTIKIFIKTKPTLHHKLSMKIKTIYVLLVIISRNIFISIDRFISMHSAEFVCNVDIPYSNVHICYYGNGRKVRFIFPC